MSIKPAMADMLQGGLTFLGANHRAGGNGMAGTGMAVPVFEEEKWHRLDSNLCVH